MKSSLKVAAAQFTPVFLDKKACIQKACDIIYEAGKQGIKLVVFPEAFIPGYPDWVWVIPPGKKSLINQVFETLIDNSVSIPDESTKKLCAAARKSKVFVVIGVSERNSQTSNASLFNSMLYIDDEGKIIGYHRKLVPTGGERLMWAGSDNNSLDAYETSIGKLGGLICWENYMPLARFAMYQQGVQIYAAGTWDDAEIWRSSMRHIAKEGGMFVISSCQTLSMSDIPDKYEFKKLYAPSKDWINVGNSCIIAPDGNIIAGPLNKEEGLVTAEIELSKIPHIKWMLDTAGHYSRNDVFNFSVKKNNPQ